MLSKTHFELLLTLHLPVLSALLLEAHLIFLSQSGSTAQEYLLTAMQLLFEGLPFFAAHQLASQHRPGRALMIWIIGFVGYPMVSFLVTAQSTAFANWSLLSMQGWILALLASGAWFISRGLASRHKTRSMKIFSRLFDLNIVMSILLMGWALIVAGIFNSHHDPMNNQPIEAVVDIASLYNNFWGFIGYLWQFLLIASIVAATYALNRYVLIRRILARQGVLAFAMAALMCIIVATPIFAQAMLWLPVNTAEHTLLPSADHNIFAALNYQVMFWLLAVSTPLILAFERQQQHAALANIAQQQTHTELQLLQQQINPHFLFNTLNNLYALTLTQSKQAPDLIMQLSNLLRYTVYEGQKDKVSLAQEVAYLQNYIALQQIRHGDKCTLDLQWPEQREDTQLSPLLLIILLENAFKYGVEPSIEHAQIRFHLRLEHNTLTLECDNPITEQQPKSHGGLGLTNLRRRLTLLYPGKHSLQTGPRGNRWHTRLELELSPC